MIGKWLDLYVWSVWMRQWERGRETVTDVPNEKTKSCIMTTTTTNVQKKIGDLW